MKREVLGMMLFVLLTSGFLLAKEASKRKELQKEVIGKDGVPMVLVPAGEFLMGSPGGEGNSDPTSYEYPRHKVYLDAYYIDRYEVTNEQYAKFLNESHVIIEKGPTITTGAKDRDGNFLVYDSIEESDRINKTLKAIGMGVPNQGVIYRNNKWQSVAGYEKCPVTWVTWYGADQYAKHYGKRLPTEAEWEYACRAGSNTKYCFGDNESKLEEYGWYTNNSNYQTHPIGTKKPNQWGIYDMHGNVWEWCSDWYSADYYETSPEKNPQGPQSGGTRVLRGGGWSNAADKCHSATRSWSAPYDNNVGDGFRCVVSMIQ